MTLLGNFKRFLYSGAASSAVVQGDPDLSLGGFRPDNANLAGSEPYVAANFDSNSTSRYIVQDNETDTPGSADPAVGDWLTTMRGPAAPGFGKIVAVNYGTGEITLDRALPGLALTTNSFRRCRRENLFPDVTAEQARVGLVDHRMIYAFKQNVGTENNFRFWIDPIQPNGCDIEIVASGTWLADGASVTANSQIADPEESPFAENGRIATGNASWARAIQPKFAYSEGGAVPNIGSANSSDEGALAIWLRRTIPPSAQPGECVFMLNLIVPDALTQDASADPTPFSSGFIFSWNNPEPTVAIRIFSDRKLHTGGQARIIAEITNSDGTPLVGWNARLTLASGGGSLSASLDQFTDERGRVQGVYSAPASTGSNPVFRVDLPMSVRV